MSDLWIETGWLSLNHVGETLCGDKVEIFGGGDEDLTLVLHDRMYWAECIIFASLFLVVTFTVNKPIWIFPVSIPLFVVFDGWWRMHLHKSWANGRMRQ